MDKIFNKRKMIGVVMEESEVKQIDAQRGKQSRSAYLRELILLYTPTLQPKANTEKPEGDPASINQPDPTAG